MESLRRGGPGKFPASSSPRKFYAAVQYAIPAAAAKPRFGVR